MSGFCILPLLYDLCTFARKNGVGSGWLSATGLRTLFLNEMSCLQPLYSHRAFLSSVQRVVCESPAGFNHLPTSIGSAPGSHWRCGHEKWTVLGGHSSNLPARVVNPSSRKNGNPTCSPQKHSEGKKTEQCWNTVATVNGAHLTSCQGVQGRGKWYSQYACSRCSHLPPHLENTHFQVFRT